jgi:small GTP-binding protein
MIKKKVCMLGSFAVGKTSLVQQFVKSIFSEKYQTTIGVKIDQKELKHEGQDVKLLLWDIHGEDDFQKVRASYLTGAEGVMLVADGTRSGTLDVAKDLKQLADNTLGNKPFLLLVNKSDLTEDWELSGAEVESLKEKGWEVYFTSAKTGENVESAFRQLTQQMLR